MKTITNRNLSNSNNLLAPLIAALIALVSSTLLHGQETFGYLQVNAEPGLSIHINGHPKGITTKKEGGKYLRLAPGKYTVKVSKTNFDPFFSIVEIKANDVTELKPRFVNNARIEIEESGDKASGTRFAQTGSLLIRSLPIQAIIKIPALGIDVCKTKNEWTIRNVPVGNYEVTVVAGGKPVTFNALVEKGETTKHLVNGPEQRVIDIKKEEKLAEERDRKRALAIWHQATSRHIAGIAKLEKELEALSLFTRSNPPVVKTQGNDGERHTLWKAQVTMKHLGKPATSHVLKFQGKHLLVQDPNLAITVTGPHLHPVKHWKVHAKDRRLESIQKKLRNQLPLSKAGLERAKQNVIRNNPKLAKHFPINE